MKYNSLCRLFACLLLMNGSLFGQASVDLRLLAFNAQQKVPEIYLHDPEQPDAVSVKGEVKNYLNHHVSKIPLKGRKIVFSGSADRQSLSSEGGILAEATLPQGVNSSILLFLPSNPGSKLKYNVMVIPDSKRAFPGGSYYVANLSNTQFRLVLETKVFDFKPGKSELIEDPPTRSGNVIGVRAVAFINNVWKEVSSSIWNHPGRRRSVIIIYPTSNGIEMKGFDDIAPKEPSEIIEAAQ